MDTRYWRKEVLEEFIDIYRQHECLWKVKSKLYTNKNLKNCAYNKLIELCKRNDMKADKIFVVNKIQALCGAFRKEQKKVENSIKSGASAEDKYIPSLWYYNLLLFTKDQDELSSSFSNSACEKYYSPKCFVKMFEEEEEELEESCSEAPKEKTINNRDLSIPTRKRQKREKDKRAPFFKACTEAITKKDEDCAFGINVLAKLRKMDEMQRIYAENLINQILYKGTLNKITENTEIQENYIQNITYSRQLSVPEERTNVS